MQGFSLILNNFIEKDFLNFRKRLAGREDFFNRKFTQNFLFLIKKMKEVTD